jgi:hypothetical protein
MFKMKVKIYGVKVTCMVVQCLMCWFNPVRLSPHTQQVVSESGCGSNKWVVIDYKRGKTHTWLEE